MATYHLSHLPDHVLLRELSSLVVQDRATTAALLAHIAEVDERRLYLPRACASMYAYCVQELRMSEDVAYKRIRAARLAGRFPAIFPALANGGLNLSSLLALAPHLTTQSAGELLAAASGKSGSEIEELLAERFPRPDVRFSLMPVFSSSATLEPCQLAARPVVPSELPQKAIAMGPLAGAREAASPLPSMEGAPLPEVATVVTQPAQVLAAPPPAPRPRLTPLAPERYALQVTLDQETHDLLREARELLGHTSAGGDVADVLKRGLQELVNKLRARRCAAVTRPRPGTSSHPATSPRPGIRRQEDASRTPSGAPSRRDGRPRRVTGPRHDARRVPAATRRRGLVPVSAPAPAPAPVPAFAT
jgi:hypothetical protein